MPRKRRTFSIDFKKGVVAEYSGGEPLHRVARRNGINRSVLSRRSGGDSEAR